MRLISPTDSMFLLTESREHPMHVGGLQLFKPPDGAGPQFVREAYEAMIAAQEVQPTFCKHPAKIPGGITNVAWSFDDDIDLDYHLRRSAVPSPGRVRELLELTSRLHGSLLDRHRPQWEAHLIEGVSALKLMQRALTADPTKQHRHKGAVGPATPAPRPQLGEPVAIGRVRSPCGFGAGPQPRERPPLAFADYGAAPGVADRDDRDDGAHGLGSFSSNG
jgi:diacylglycerol O-acyltransferase